MKAKRASLIVGGLATAGAVTYGAKKLYDNRNKNKPVQKESIMFLNKNDKKDLTYAMKKSIINEFKRNPKWFGERLKEAVIFADQLMYTGFKYASRGGASIGIEDMQIPDDKAAIIEQADDEVREIRQGCRKGHERRLQKGYGGGQ